MTLTFDSLTNTIKTAMRLLPNDMLQSLANLPDETEVYRTVAQLMN
jgi:hypothetical protein